LSRSTPPVSIGLPVYNGERYLREALESLLAQTYTDFELVVGDNGSTDATRDIALEAANRDSRVHYLPSDENRGAAWNYNRVFHETGGRYFRWAAYDDLVAPTYLERLVEAMDAAPTLTVLAQTQTLFIDEDGNEVGPWDDRFDLSSQRAWNRLAQLVRHLVKSNVLFGLMRRSALERTRMHGAYPSADYVLLSELALLGTWVVVPERLFLRRVHPGMSRLANRRLEDVAEWFEPGTGEEARPEFLRLFSEHLRSIASSPLGWGERSKAFAAFLPVWFVRHRRGMARELWGVAGRRLRVRA
jgi:glycosyltransferase involved in cell wall biosynthesis